MSDDDERLIGRAWLLQTVVAAEVDDDAPFVITLTFADGYRATVNLSGRGTGPLAIALRDQEKFREVFVDDELGTIAWPNGYDIDPDRLRMLAIEQHPEDTAAVPPLPPWSRP